MVTQEVASQEEDDAASTPPELIVESGLAGLPKRLTNELRALESDGDHSAATPAQSTRSRTRKPSTITNMARALCTAAAIANCGVTPQAAAARQYPLQLFVEMANDVLDSETGELLEYRHLLNHPEYKNMDSLISQ